MHLLGKQKTASGKEEKYGRGIFCVLLFFGKCILWTMAVAIIMGGIISRNNELEQDECSIGYGLVGRLQECLKSKLNNF